MKAKELIDTRPARVLRRIAEIFIREHVTRSAAALSYCVTISLFPLLLCATAVLGSLNITENELFFSLRDIIPSAAIDVISDFLGYVNGNMTALMTAAGLGVMITSSSSAFRTIMGVMGGIQGEKRFSGLLGHLASFVMSLAFLAAVYASGLVIVTGEWFMGALKEHLALGDITAAWLWMRFLLLFLIMFAMIYAIYKVTAPKAARGEPRTRRLPGALAAAALVVAVSAAFSRMISASAKYALVYGSLASVIIMMIWMYACAIILIMGNVFNVALAETEVPYAVG
ncbi:MAG: YihY/virulence factor BrkB family protein [Oscillospiraceae bacterium]|jgi:membrane protein|nr:YihY/virulence factor BrkB family protein [Oscillospiraceae bacterium]